MSAPAQYPEPSSEVSNDDLWIAAHRILKNEKFHSLRTLVPVGDELMPFVDELGRAILALRSATAAIDAAREQDRARAAAPQAELVTVGAMHQCRPDDKFDRCVHCGAMAEELARPCKNWMAQADAAMAEAAAPQAAVGTINGKPATADCILAALIDIYDDEQKNAPEHRCYIDSAWNDVLKVARTFLALSPATKPEAPAEPLQEFESPRAKILMRAWEEGWEACRDAEFVGEEAQNDAFNRSQTVNHCISEDQLHAAPAEAPANEGYALPVMSEPDRDIVKAALYAFSRDRKRNITARERAAILGAALAAPAQGDAKALADAELLHWLESQLVDTIYLDDGRIIDVGTGRIGQTDVRVAPHALRDALRAARQSKGGASHG